MLTTLLTCAVTVTVAIVAWFLYTAKKQGVAVLYTLAMAGAMLGGPGTTLARTHLGVGHTIIIFLMACLFYGATAVIYALTGRDYRGAILDETVTGFGLTLVIVCLPGVVVGGAYDSPSWFICGSTAMTMAAALMITRLAIARIPTLARQSVLLALMCLCQIVAMMAALWHDVGNQQWANDVAHAAALAVVIAMPVYLVVRAREGRISPVPLDLRPVVSLHAIALSLIGFASFLAALTQDTSTASAATLYMVLSLVACVLGRQRAVNQAMTMLHDSARAQQQHYELILGSTADALGLCRHDNYDVVYASPVARDLLGVDPSAIVGQPLYDVVGITIDELDEACLDMHGSSGVASWCFRHRQRYLQLTLVMQRKFVRFTITDITKRHAIERNLHNRASIDALTGMPNRHEMLSRAAQRSHGNTPAAVLFIDLNGFKPINDTHGHHVGDDMLICIARALNELAGTHAEVGRLGGDEFLMVTDGDLDHAQALAEQVIDTLSGVTLRVGRTQVTVGCAIGIARLDGVSHIDAVRHADLAMYAAKLLPHSAAAVFNAREHALASGEPSEAVTAAAEAWAAGNVELALQPMVAGRGDDVVGAEALLRWVDADGVWQTPLPLLQHLHEAGAGFELARWVISRAVELLATTPESALRLSVNVAVGDVLRPEFVADTISAVNHHRIARGRLIVELSETEPVADMAAAAQACARLQEAGVLIFLDDLAAGYSTLSTVAGLPLDGIKIDGAACRALETNLATRIVLAELVGFANSRGQVVVAEGIESPTHELWARRVGCHIRQGFYYARPRLAPECLTELAEAAVIAIGTANSAAEPGADPCPALAESATAVNT